MAVIWANHCTRDKVVLEVACRVIEIKETDVMD